MRILLVLLVLALSGCGTLQEYLCEPDLGAKEVKIDRQVLEPCAPQLKLEGSTPEDLLVLHGENTKLFKACVAKQDDSAKLIRKLANIPEVK